VETPSSRSSSPVVVPAGRASVRRSCMPTQGLRFPSLPQKLEEEGYKGAHRSGRDRLEREVGKAQMGGGTHTGLARYRRLSVRYERRDDIHQAFLHLGCSLICLNYLK
jgi:hypothetical protein